MELLPQYIQMLKFKQLSFTQYMKRRSSILNEYNYTQSTESACKTGILV